MSAVFYLSLLSVSLLTGAAGAELVPPLNVAMVTLNTNYALKWDWDQSAAEGHDATFTTQYVGMYKLKMKNHAKSWITVCENTAHMSCDLTTVGMEYLGMYMIRVRANVNGNHSDWVMIPFGPDKDAALGPPTKVDLATSGSGLDVYITDPLTSTNSSMRDHIDNLSFHILYWERTEDTQALRTLLLPTNTNVVTLPDLKAWTWYCVSVRSHYHFYNKNSSFTSPQCLQTEGPVPWWIIFLSFLGSLVMFFLLVLLSLYVFIRCFKTVKSTFFPSSQLPKHFQEYFCDSPGSDIPRLLTPDSEGELLCHKVSICPEPVFLEIHDPPPEALLEPASGLEPDSSGRHSRQGSSGSGDSGVYSTEGGSGQRHPNSAQSSSGAEDSWQGPIKPNQVKMLDMAPDLKSQRPIGDELIVDVCV
ncbi:interleukin-10 receptor subunit beta [Scomber japonicus]|uniref:interleukin-10 receptor subunit beta n=1 Tax=Scomber japonicus TaxID=13676 RepID=UPI002305E38F|nr:interleukin-10 receptor subunit beta [Scomber japonicus]